jgi:hypothetical protein
MAALGKKQKTTLSIQLEGGKNLIHPTIHIKRVIIDSSDL